MLSEHICFRNLQRKTDQSGERSHEHQEQEAAGNFPAELQHPERNSISLTSDNLFVLDFLYVLQDIKSELWELESPEKDTEQRRNNSVKSEKKKLPPPKPAEDAERSRIFPEFSRTPKIPKILLEYPKGLRKMRKKNEAQNPSGGQPKAKIF